jgi:hypothetical protein
MTWCVVKDEGGLIELYRRMVDNCGEMVNRCA